VIQVEEPQSVVPLQVLPPVIVGSTPDNYKVLIDQIDNLLKSLVLLGNTSSAKFEAIVQ